MSEFEVRANGNEFEVYVDGERVQNVESYTITHDALDKPVVTLNVYPETSYVKIHESDAEVIFSLEALLRDIFTTLVEYGQMSGEFYLGETIRFSPSEVEKILREHWRD